MICEYTEKTRTARYRKSEIQDQNDAPHMRTKEAINTPHDKRLLEDAKY